MLDLCGQVIDRGDPGFANFNKERIGRPFEIIKLNPLRILAGLVGKILGNVDRLAQQQYTNKNHNQSLKN